jgi:hypothetical protein
MARTTRRTDEGMVVPLRLPRTLHERLKAEADAAQRTFAAEVRRRLEASLAAETTAGGDDPKTRQLLAGIAKLASEIGTFYAPWHENPYSLAVLRSAVDTLLGVSGPKGEPVYQPDPNKLLDMFFDPKADPPEKIGRMMAMTALTGSTEDKP